MIRVLIAEDQRMVRDALASLLSLEDDIEVVAELGRGDLVLPAALTHDVDVALLDIEMPGQDGIETAAELAREHPSTRSLILTTFGRPGYLRRAIESGAAGFLLKDAPAEKLAAAIRDVHAGNRVVDPGLAAAAIADGVSPLTERERDVLAVAADGQATAAEIGARLHLSEGTVRNYVSTAIRKLGAKNRTDAARIAADKGWLGPPVDHPDRDAT
ncbi:MAG TPA: response regulator transcription factor [Gaiella sp.]